MRFPSSFRGGAAGVLAGWCALLGACSKSESGATTAAAPAAGTPAAPAAAPAAPAPAAEAPAEVRKMLGKWLRSDGTYVLELRGAEAGGTVRAAYFNPKSINVSRAIWMRGGDGLQVAIELNDVGYPGAMYVLNYDPKADRLSGNYTQPQMQQTFEVDFVRQKYP